MGEMGTKAPLRWLATVVAATTLGAVAVGACSNDDNSNKAGSTSTTAALTGTKAACQQWVKIDTAAGKGPGGSDEQPTPAQGKAFASTLAGLFPKFVANAPSDIKDATTDIQSRLTAAQSSGDLSHLDPSSDETFAGELDKIETWVHDSCGFQNVDLVGVDYEFQGMPATLKAGPVSIVFTNKAKDEFHEVNVALVKPGVSVDDIMTAIRKNADQAQGKYQGDLTFINNTGAPPGGSSAITLNLTKGTYLVTCFVPVGGKEGAPPHAQMGMMQKFTVS